MSRRSSLFFTLNSSDHSSGPRAASTKGKRSERERERERKRERKEDLAPLEQLCAYMAGEREGGEKNRSYAFFCTSPVIGLTSTDCRMQASIYKAVRAIG